MKKIINGKMYNTETAKYIDYAAEGACDSFNSYHWREELYKKRTGEYFIFGEGGASSRWRCEVERGCYSDGWGFKPLTDDEAKEWLEKYGDPDVYIAEFGEPEE